MCVWQNNPNCASLLEKPMKAHLLQTLVSEKVSITVTKPSGEEVLPKYEIDKSAPIADLRAAVMTAHEASRSCLSRSPCVGDCVRLHGDRVPRGLWSLGPGEVATVEELGAHGTFRLLNPRGNESNSVNADLFTYVDDQPGTYVITSTTNVTSHLTANSPLKTSLGKSAKVEVLEVIAVPEEKCIRARVQDPAGWISLTDWSEGACLRLAEKSAVRFNLIFGDNLLEDHAKVGDSGLEDGSIVTAILVPAPEEDDGIVTQKSNLFKGFEREGDSRVPTMIFVIWIHAIFVLTLEQLCINCLDSHHFWNWFQSVALYSFLLVLLGCCIVPCVCPSCAQFGK
jgi:hypothetical protein